MRAHRGFTLLEILVVMVIVGILSALLAPNFVTGSRERDMRREAQSLAARIRLVQDEAMFYGREYGLVVDDTRYRFVAWDTKDNRFRAVADPLATWASHELPEDMHMEVVADAEAPILALPSPDEATAAEPQAATAGTPTEEEPVYEPVAFVLSSGEVTPFTAVFRLGEGDARAEVRIDPLGNRIDEEGGNAPAPAR